MSYKKLWKQIYENKFNNKNELKERIRKLYYEDILLYDEIYLFYK
jgi:hypothetical protein